MNKIEEIYVFCNKVSWHTSYIPEMKQSYTHEQTNVSKA